MLCGKVICRRLRQCRAREEKKKKKSDGKIDACKANKEGEKTGKGGSGRQNG